ncbi:MAG: GNAT family N-acetyltransferase [Acinetobacter sp.]|nr:GNAT family N-acetyltransferase [Acinetobacter sp.]
MSTITHHAERNRFEISIDGYTAYLSYVVDGDRLIYDHTIVPSELGGRGLGKALAQYALDYAAQQGKKVVPACSFVAAFIEKNPQYQSLLV